MTQNRPRHGIARATRACARRLGTDKPTDWRRHSDTLLGADHVGDRLRSGRCDVRAECERRLQCRGRWSDPLGRHCQWRLAADRGHCRDQLQSIAHQSAGSAQDLIRFLNPGPWVAGVSTGFVQRPPASAIAHWTVVDCAAPTCIAGKPGVRLGSGSVPLAIEFYGIRRIINPTRNQRVELFSGDRP